MFRVSLRALAPKVKATTGFVNFPVVPNPGPVLLGLYKQTLTELQKFPADASYRTNMEKIIKHRSYVVENSNNNYEYIEREIGCGQVEELIEQAKDELELIPVLLETKCWEKNA